MLIFIFLFFKGVKDKFSLKNIGISALLICEISLKNCFLQKRRRHETQRMEKLADVTSSFFGLTLMRSADVTNNKTNCRKVSILVKKQNHVIRVVHGYGMARVCQIP